MFQGKPIEGRGWGAMKAIASGMALNNPGISGSDWAGELDGMIEEFEDNGELVD